MRDITLSLRTRQPRAGWRTYHLDEDPVALDRRSAFDIDLVTRCPGVLGYQRSSDRRRVGHLRRGALGRETSHEKRAIWDGQSLQTSCAELERVTSHHG
jgi:hypothetical protein